MLLDRFIRSCREHHLIEEGSTVVAAVSGGIDSIVLLDLLAKWRERGAAFRLAAAHYDHHLRSGSSHDREHVERTCAGYGLECISGEGDVASEAAKTGRAVHDIAREMRYEFLANAALGIHRDVGGMGILPLIATGHHLDDQAETLLMRLISGSGVEGLSGLRRSLDWGNPVVVRIVRLLIDLRRDELENYCRERSLVFLEDATNLDLKYPRNRLRYKVLPVIEEQFGSAAIKGIARSARLMHQMSELLESELERLYADAVLEVSPGELILDYKQLTSYLDILRQNCILKATRHIAPDSHRITFERCRAADRHILCRRPGNIEMGSGVNINVFEDKVFFFSEPASYSAFDLPIPGQSVIPGWGHLEAEVADRTEAQLPPGEGILYLSKEKLKGENLSVEPVKPGERFNPLGMRGSRKVSDFLYDAGVPPHRRKRYPVVKSFGRIVAIPPCRIADWGKITGETRRVVCLKWRKC